MHQYLITVWEQGRQWCYLIGTTDIAAYKKTLNEIHNRYTVEYRGKL